MISKGVRVAGAVVAFGLAVFAVAVAALTKALICGGDAGTTCRTGLMTVQLLVAVGGLLPACGLVVAVLDDHPKAATLSLIAGIGMYAGWGVLNDAVVHGW
jgi:hypothetical protein